MMMNAYTPDQILELTLIFKSRTFRFYLALILTTVNLFAAIRCHADVTSDLLDPKLEEQYDWAMYMDVREIKNYLNYPTSRLHPVTNLKIIYRPLAKGRRSDDYVKARVYEEFWYHDHVAIGLKRNQRLQIESNKFGIIFVQPIDGESDHMSAIANALVRIMVDLWLNNIVAGYIVVPYNQFDQLSGELGRYGFFPGMKISAGAQLSVHLRSSPVGKDQLLYFHKGFQ